MVRRRHPEAQPKDLALVLRRQVLRCAQDDFNIGITR
jgi:hypothetical protein